MKLKAEVILEKLIEKFERSKLSKEGSSRNLRILLYADRDFPDYFRMDHYQESRILDDDLKQYEARGWVRLTWDDGLLNTVELITDQAETAARFLHRPIRSVHDKNLYDLLQRYEGQGIDLYLQEVEHRLTSFRGVSALTFDDPQLQEDLLKTLCTIVNLSSDISERVFSVRVLGNSKAFERIRTKIVHILRQFFSAEDEETTEDVLAQFHVLKNPGHLMIKGHGRLVVGSSIIQIEDFQEGLTLTSADLENIIFETIPTSCIMTVENLTSFYNCSKQDTLILYLGGYHNTVRRTFLQKIYELFPEKKYLHFGDIDAGGFYILEHLKTKTGIPFSPYRMSVEELQTHEKYTIPLTVNDRSRLEKLISIPDYSNTIRYMLEHNVKLEQEALIECL